MPEFTVAPFEIHNHQFSRLKRQASSASTTDRKLPSTLQKNLELILQAFDKKFNLQLTKSSHLLDRQPKVFYADMVDGVPVLKDATPEVIAPNSDYNVASCNLKLST